MVSQYILLVAIILLCHAVQSNRLLRTSDKQADVALSNNGLKVLADIGEKAFNRKFSACPVIEYVRNGKTHSVYKRISSAEGFNAYKAFTHTWTNSKNKFHVDFEIYDSVEDLTANRGKWNFCNFNDRDVGYPRDCGKTRAVGNQWFSMPGERFNARGLSSGASFHLFDAERCPISQKDPCENISGYTNKCAMTAWSGQHCFVKVFTNGGNCKSFCESQGTTCIKARDDDGTTCGLKNDNNDSCTQTWKNQLCVCGKYSEPVSKAPTTYKPLTSKPLTKASDVKVVNDFSSKAAMEKDGWRFNWNDRYVFAPPGPYCKNVPSTSYCGFRHPGDGKISYTLTGFGIATLVWGQGWNVGSVHIRKNNQEISSRSKPGKTTTQFVFAPNDVLDIVELGGTVINIHSLTLTPDKKLVKRCDTVADKKWDPINFGSHGRSVEASPEACEARCESTAGCIGSSFWRNGGCHLAGEGAILVNANSIQSSICDSIVFSPEPKKQNKPLWPPAQNKPKQKIVRHICGTTGKQSTGKVLTTLPLGFEESEKTACDCRSACQRESRCYSWDYRVVGKQIQCTLRSGQILKESNDENTVAGLSDVFSFVPGKEGFKKCAEKGKKCKCTGFARFGGEISNGQFAFTPARLIKSDVLCEQNWFPEKMINKFGKKPFCECKHSELSEKFEIPSTSEMYGFFATDEQKDKMSEENLQQILRSTAPLHFGGLAEHPLGLLHALEFPAVEMGIMSAKSCDAMKKPEFQNSGSPFLCGAPLAFDFGAVIDGLENVGLGMAADAFESLVGADKALGTDEIGVADMCMGSFNMKSPAHLLMDPKCRTDIFDERSVAGTFSTHINVGLFGVNLCATIDPCDGGFYVQMENDWIATNIVDFPKSLFELVAVGVSKGSELGFGVSPSRNFKREYSYWNGEELHGERITKIYKGRFAVNFQMDLGEAIQGLIQHMIWTGAKKVAKNAAGIDSSSWIGWGKEKVVTGVAGWAATTTASKFAENRGWPILDGAFGTAKAEIMLGLDFIDELVAPDFGKWFEDQSEGTAFQKVMWLIAQNSALITAEMDLNLDFNKLTRGKLDFVLNLAEANVQLLADGVNKKIHFAATVKSNLIRELCNMVARMWPNMADLGKLKTENQTFKKSKGKGSYQCPEWLNNFNLDAKIDILLGMVGDEDDTFQVGFRVDADGSKKKGSETCLEAEFACEMFFNNREPFVMRCNIFGIAVGINNKGAAYQVTETAEVDEDSNFKNVIDKFGECGLAMQKFMNDWLIRKPAKAIKAIFVGASEGLDNAIENLGEQGNYLQMIGARDDNGVVYALGVGMEKTGEVLTMLKGMLDEAVGEIRRTCDKAFTTTKTGCMKAATDIEYQCNNSCKKHKHRCKRTMDEANRSCQKKADLCDHCRRACKTINAGLCATRNWLHEEAGVNTHYGAHIAWCGTQKAANAMCFWCSHTFDFEGCKRDAWNDKLRREREHRETYQKCRKDIERKCQEDAHCSVVENMFEGKEGRCDQLCKISVGKAMQEFSCQIVGENMCEAANCVTQWFVKGTCDTLDALGTFCETDERIKKTLRRQMLEDFKKL